MCFLGLRVFSLVARRARPEAPRSSRPEPQATTAAVRDLQVASLATNKEKRKSEFLRSSQAGAQQAAPLHVQADDAHQCDGIAFGDDAVAEMIVEAHFVALDLILKVHVANNVADGRRDFG